MKSRFRHFWIVAGMCALGFAGSAGSLPNVLLPRPQELHYGPGSLPLEKLTIRFAMKPGEQDRFAADQLAAGLWEKAGIAMSIRESRGSGHAIVLERTGEGAMTPGTNEASGPGCRESYTISVTTGGATIRAPASAGLFYGVQTFLQMVESNGAARLPVAEVRDWPALPYRGFMMDLSHGQLLRVSEIERQIDLLSRFKGNQYFLYSEMNVAMDGYELVNPDARYTRAEIRHLIDYALRRHMDLAPCIELYGHMHDLFRVEKMSDLSLPRYGDEFDPRNPAAMRTMVDLLSQNMDLFPSPWIHVGFDEPWSLGKIGLTPGVDPFQKFIGILGRLSEQAQGRGRRLVYWADIANGSSTLSSHPDLPRQLPPAAVAAPWAYDPETNYDRIVEPLAREHVPILVTPAIWNWNEIFPDYHHSFYNINGLTASGKKFGALGMLNTGWTDCGQTLYRQSLPGLAFGAAAGWQAAPVDTNTFFTEYTSLMYPAAEAAELAPALEELSTVEAMFEDILANATWHAFWRDPLEPNYLARLEKRRSDLHEARLLAESAKEHLWRARTLAPGDPTLKSLLMAASLFDYLGMKCLYAVEWAGYFRELKGNPDPKLVTLYIGIQMNAQDHGMVADLMDEITGLRQPYKEAWLEESTSYRLGTALARWDAEAQHWLATWHHINELLRNRKKDEPFPSIDVLR